MKYNGYGVDDIINKINLLYIDVYQSISKPPLGDSQSNNKVLNEQIIIISGANNKKLISSEKKINIGNAIAVPRDWHFIKQNAIMSSFNKITSASRETALILSEVSHKTYTHVSTERMNALGYKIDKFYTSSQRILQNITKDLELIHAGVMINSLFGDLIPISNMVHDAYVNNLWPVAWLGEFPHGKLVVYKEQ